MSNEPLPLTLIVEEAEFTRLEQGEIQTVYRPITYYWWSRLFSSPPPLGFPRIIGGSYDGIHQRATIRYSVASSAPSLICGLGLVGASRTPDRLFIQLGQSFLR